MCKNSNRPVWHRTDALVGYDIVGGRKGLYYDATKLLSYVPIASMIEAFGQLESLSMLAKFRDGTVTIEPTGTSTSPTCSHDLHFRISCSKGSALSVTFSSLQTHTIQQVLTVHHPS
jgi:hypothetical protein